MGIQNGLVAQQDWKGSTAAQVLASLAEVSPMDKGNMAKEK
jgi:hypothetical protein